VGGWLLAARLARRELRSGLGGFRLFLACLALGVAAITAILSFSRAIEEGLRGDARQIMGGDVAISSLYRDLAPEQQQAIAGRGAVSRWVDSRAMAHPEANGHRSALVQLKAVDPAYPLYGKLELKDGADLQPTLAQRDGIFGAVVEESALTRMGVAIGDRIRVADVTVEVRGVIAREPDRGINAFATLGPRLMLPLQAILDNGGTQPGSLITWEYRLRLASGTADRAVIGDLQRAFPQASWRLRGLAQAGGAIRVWLDRLTQFMSLIGLAALLVGGVGVGNAVSSFLAKRARTIATLKCLGAPASLVFRLYFLQLGLLALLGVLIGVAIGAALPFLADAMLAELLPVRARVALYTLPIVQAGLFGLLVALLFTLLPLLRARTVPAQALMRGAVEEAGRGPGWRDVLAGGVIAAALVAFTLWVSPDRRIALWFVLGAIGAFAAFPLLARGVMALARRAGRPRFAPLRLALANLYRPAAPTPTVMLSLGLGLTVLVASALIESNLHDQVTRRIPRDAPSFFFVDVQSQQIGQFERTIAAIEGAGRLDKVPSLRGRIVRIGGRPVSEVPVPPNARWSIDSDRGVTYAATPPEGTRIVAGEWWPPDYKGPPLIAFDAELARAFGIGVGDTITLNVLGRDIEARIANLRQIEWQTLAINFVFVFAPGVLERAPHTFLATVRSTPAAEERLFDAVTQRFPNVTVVRVKDALDTAAEVLGNIGLASRAVGALSILAGLLVLAGAMLAAQQRRTHEAVVMKVLGATRARIAGVFALEFVALGLVTALASIGVGSIAAWTVIRHLMALDWTFQPAIAVAVALAAVVITLGFGLAGTVGALRQRPLALLRNE
jgi:putative ABC transport system permease protein